MDRKNFFKDGLKEVAREVIKSPMGAVIDRQMLAISNLLAPVTLEQTLKEQPSIEEGPVQLPRKFSRPPGALKDPKKFNKACTRCGDCIVACPYGTLFQLGPGSGPLLDPALNACRLCPDTPCITSCETGALKKLRKGSLPKFGRAIVTEQLCRNHESRMPHNVKTKGGKRKVSLCKICKDECPVKGVIQFDKKTGIPDISRSCTGCGMCVQVCPTRAIEVEVK